MSTQYTLEFEFRNQRYRDAQKGLEAFARHVRQDWDGAAKVLGRELRSFLNSVATALSRRHTNPWPGGTGEKTLSRRSGELVASIEKSVRVKGGTFDNLTGYISAAFPGIVHEFGATIKPRTAKFLTVPLPAALDSKGVPLKKKARDWNNTFVARSKAGNLLIFQRRGSQIVPLYVLKSSVTIPPRLGMRATLQAGLPYFVDRVMDQLVKDILVQ
ncbi:MAG: hypothetical protein KJZ83_00355 [Burkholderiaceae bacterium]|nr:hypothetical protein [Burkholderiaceae bacterium]